MFNALAKNFDQENKSPVCNIAAKPTSTTTTKSMQQEVEQLEAPNFDIVPLVPDIWRKILN